MMSAQKESEWRDGFADWSRDTVLNADPTSLLFVIELDGLAFGRLRVVRDPVTAAVPGPTCRIQLAGIQLIPRMQGRGIGTAIIRDLQSEAEREGVPLDVGVEKDNPKARVLYERLGCVLIGEDDNEYLLRWTPSSAHP